PEASPVDAEASIPDAAPRDATIEASADGGWRTVFDDEFDGTGGPNPTYWHVEVGKADDQQLQYNTARPENISLDGSGHLNIVALHESALSMDHGFTSSRIPTELYGGFQYGRFEARIKVPAQRPGLWLQWWLLGDNYALVGYPACGDITIMEHLTED